ncbi:hypothetical protein TCAP_03047, partial [Tolypocladium capitatum]
MTTHLSCRAIGRRASKRSRMRMAALSSEHSRTPRRPCNEAESGLPAPRLGARLIMRHHGPRDGRRETHDRQTYIFLCPDIPRLAREFPHRLSATRPFKLAGCLLEGDGGGAFQLHPSSGQIFREFIHNVRVTEALVRKESRTHQSNGRYWAEQGSRHAPCGQVDCECLSSGD